MPAAGAVPRVERSTRAFTPPRFVEGEVRRPKGGVGKPGRSARSLLEIAPLLRLVLAFSFHSPIPDP